MTVRECGKLHSLFEGSGLKHDKDRIGKRVVQIKLMPFSIPPRPPATLHTLALTANLLDDRQMPGE